MNVNQLFPSKYVKGAELGGPVTVTIERLAQEEVYRPGEGKAQAVVMYCQGAKRGIVLNRVLALQIAEAVGEPDTDAWQGKRVVLYPQPMNVAGRAVVAIRARKVNGAS